MDNKYNVEDYSTLKLRIDQLVPKLKGKHGVETIEQLPQYRLKHLEFLFKVIELLDTDLQKAEQQKKAEILTGIILILSAQVIKESFNDSSYFHESLSLVIGETTKQNKVDNQSIYQLVEKSTVFIKNKIFLTENAKIILSKSHPFSNIKELKLKDFWMEANTLSANARKEEFDEANGRPIDDTNTSSIVTTSIPSLISPKSLPKIGTVYNTSLTTLDDTQSVTAKKNKIPSLNELVQAFANVVGILTGHHSEQDYKKLPTTRLCQVEFIHKMHMLVNKSNKSDSAKALIYIASIDVVIAQIKLSYGRLPIKSKLHELLNKMLIDIFKDNDAELTDPNRMSYRLIQLKNFVELQIFKNSIDSGQDVRHLTKNHPFQITDFNLNETFKLIIDLIKDANEQIFINAETLAVNPQQSSSVGYFANFFGAKKSELSSEALIPTVLASAK